VLAIPPEAGPGVRTVYSCLGFVTLQTFLERASGEALDALYERLIRRPLALRARFGPVDEAIPTSLSPTSTVHDPLARALGGVSGNAGLFATVGDLAKFAQAVVRQEPPVGGLLAWGDESPPFHGRGLGWQVFRPGVFGHTGFTGCRLWFAPADGRWAALLTNRVALESDPERFRAAADALRDSVLTRAHG
jgi:CubicO group peptidase (beta-lactamase class C family)